MHDLKAYIESDLRAYPDDTRYCYKFDISKFYESVDQQTIIECVRRIFKDAKLIAILERAFVPCPGEPGRMTAPYWGRQQSPR